jgi:hypothetical protein
MYEPWLPYTTKFEHVPEFMLFMRSDLKYVKVCVIMVCIVS